MARLFSIGIDVFSASVILIPLLIALQLILFKGMSFGKKVVIIIFTLYLAGVFSAVGIPSADFIRFRPVFNFIPIINMSGDLTEPILNIILFMPLGFMLPVIWYKYRNAGRTLIAGFSLSLLIELIQIFTNRATDINDLITNTAGTFLGYLIAVFINRIAYGNFYLKNPMRDSRLYIYICGMVILVIMFISSFISRAIWAVFLS